MPKKKFRGGQYIFYRPHPNQNIFVGGGQYIFYRPPPPSNHFCVWGWGGWWSIYFIDPHQNIFVWGGGYTFSSIKNQSLKSGFSPQLFILQEKNLIFPGSLLKADHCKKKLKRGGVLFHFYWKHKQRYQCAHSGAM